MDIFQLYKPFCNKIRLLSVEDSFAVIWAYCQFLQIDGFKFPPEVEVLEKFLRDSFPQRSIAEWELELLAKEVVINGNVVASKGRWLRKWKVISDLTYALKDLENEIYGLSASPDDILVELIRIAHRQFAWQGNPPNSDSIFRYFRIFNRPAIDKICEKKLGLNVWQTFMCGVAVMGHFLDRPALTLPLKSEIKALPATAFEKFFLFTSRPLPELKSRLKVEQQYNENFAYAYSSLRAFPLIRMTYQLGEALVCPLMTLLYWRFTSGLYYEFVGVPEFANEFGEGFQIYVGDVLQRACPAPMRVFGEQEYTVVKSKKRSVDWIISDEHSALFLECKAKRLSIGAKVSLTDLAPLQNDIDYMASAVVQVYKTLTDYLDGAYPHFPHKVGRRIFPVVVTLENWRFFGPVMMDKLAKSVKSKLNDAALSADLTDQMPYSIWAIEDLEIGLQIIRGNGIAAFMDGKLTSTEKRQWDWHAYMVHQYPKSFPIKKLFDKEYDEMFAEVHAAQNLVARNTN